MRAHLGLVVFVALIAVGVVLAVIGQGFVGSVVLLGTVLVGLGSARRRSRDAMQASRGTSLPPTARRR
jgi:hypothetical protein